MELLGTSAITGDYGTCTEISNNEGTGSSDPGLADDEPVHDSEERERFDFQEMRHEVDERTVEGRREDEPTIGQQHSGGTGGTGNRSTSSNKRKSTEVPEGSRSRRAKKSITDNRATQEGILAAMGHLVKSSDRLVEQNDEFIAIQHEKIKLSRGNIPPEIVEVLHSYGLKIQQRRSVMKALKDPVDQQCFMDATPEEQREIIGEYIPGWYQPHTAEMQSNPTLLELLLLPWKKKHVFRGLKHGKDVISVNYPRKDFHGTFIARTNIISVEYHGDNPFSRN
jgi:hypothetical protein